MRTLTQHSLSATALVAALCCGGDKTTSARRPSGRKSSAVLRGVAIFRCAAAGGATA